MFDFDGLILETEEPIYRGWAEVFGEHGQELSWDLYSGMLGTSAGTASLFEALEGLLGRSVERDAITARRRAREVEAIEALPVLPGVRAHLEAARSLGIMVAVASSSTHAWVDGHLARLGLGGHWHCTVCREDVAPGRAKPAPDLYLEAVEKLGVEPGEAVAFEDSRHGVVAAKAAGLYCVAVPGPLTSAMDFSHADLVLRSLEEMSLREVIFRLTGEAPALLPPSDAGAPRGTSPTEP